MDSAIHWIKLISVHWIVQLVPLILIHWILIYPLDSTIQLLNNWGLKNMIVLSTSRGMPEWEEGVDRDLCDPLMTFSFLIWYYFILKMHSWLERSFHFGEKKCSKMNLKINQSEKTPFHRPTMGVAHSGPYGLLIPPSEIVSFEPPWEKEIGSNYWKVW